MKVYEVIITNSFDFEVLTKIFSSRSAAEAYVNSLFLIDVYNECEAKVDEDIRVRVNEVDKDSKGNITFYSYKISDVTYDVELVEQEVIGG